MTGASEQGNHEGLRRALPLAFVVLGVAVVVFALLSQVSPPTPPPSAAGTIDSRPLAVPSADPTPTPQPTPAATTTTPTPKPDETPTRRPKPKRIVSSPKPGKSSTPSAQRVEAPMPPSEPVSISIPAIDVDSPVFPIGLDAEGALEAPQPGPNLNDVAWFENSPTPGQLGPSVLEGHVDTDEGRSVFFRLGDVTPGDTVKIKREDGRTAVYTVDAVRSYAKSKFPTDLVYGTDLSRPSLRLITCSEFDQKIGHYAGNLVVFGHLTAVQQ